MTLKALNGRANHEQDGDVLSADAFCPTCDQPLKSAEQILRVQGKQRAATMEIERAIEARFARQMAKAEAAKRGEIAKAVKAAGAVTEAKLAAIRANQDAVVAASLAAEREKAQKKLDAAVTAAKLEHAAERVRLESALADVQRRLSAKPAHAIGDPAEADLALQISNMLAESAPDDRVERVARGVRGADVIVEVVHHGEVAGKIIVESKAHAKWQSAFIRRLRENVIHMDASFGILSSTVFPAGVPQHLALVEGCIVATPERVPTLVLLLRKIVCDNFVQRLGAQARDEKAARLYSFVLSPRCDELFDGLLRLTRDLLALDQTEQKTHQATFAKRAELVQGVIAIREQFVGVVADIIGGSGQ